MRKPWHIYPIGVLFGLGFDTATEVGLLVLAGGAAAFNLPFYAILVLPILFAAGMCLMDTIDGVFMNAAYGWAFAKPVRKVFYNITITAISVAVALIIGTIELVGVLADQAHITSGPIAAIADIPLDYAGYGIVALFFVAWALALAVWRFGRIEERWSADLAGPRSGSGEGGSGQQHLDDPLGRTTVVEMVEPLVELGELVGVGRLQRLRLGHARRHALRGVHPRPRRGVLPAEQRVPEPQPVLQVGHVEHDRPPGQRPVEPQARVVQDGHVGSHQQRDEVRVAARRRPRP